MLPTGTSQLGVQLLYSASRLSDLSTQIISIALSQQILDLLLDSSILLIEGDKLLVRISNPLLDPVLLIP